MDEKSKRLLARRGILKSTGVAMLQRDCARWRNLLHPGYAVDFQGPLLDVPFARHGTGQPSPLSQGGLCQSGGGTVCRESAIGHNAGQSRGQLSVSKSDRYPDCRGRHGRANAVWRTTPEHRMA